MRVQGRIYIEIILQQLGQPHVAAIGSISCSWTPLESFYEGRSRLVKLRYPPCSPEWKAGCSYLQLGVRFVVSDKHLRTQNKPTGRMKRACRADD